MSYKPQPVDTSSVTLSPDIIDLTERLAKNTHDVWAQERMAQGWHFGLERNDSRKEHPSLVPYEELPEAEKVYGAVTDALRRFEAARQFSRNVRSRHRLHRFAGDGSRAPLPPQKEPLGQRFQRCDTVLDVNPGLKQPWAAISKRLRR